ncbi:hypothetical protein DQ04_07811010 [Trypanosoma grayi]|uniref:hypothetical protein n=1 Tax=Trypanosoma grayi TaxID=71804 RepID=UPI0004F4194B|nr:hypothetical protein DQ04_07811010 [Trypanosoma grayi]KEG08181.1 hypothetical protein DQ04_07811010 [Trypanosoma grayi]
MAPVLGSITVSVFFGTDAAFRDAVAEWVSAHSWTGTHEYFSSLCCGRSRRRGLTAEGAHHICMPDTASSSFSSPMSNRKSPGFTNEDDNDDVRSGDGVSLSSPHRLALC